MKGIKKVADGIFWIGGSDRRLERFENIFPIPEGVSYNSYFIDDEKTAVFDTADITVADQYIENLKEALGDRKLDYLVVLHMEPDHCSLIDKVVALFPEVTVVGGKQTFTFMQQFFPQSQDSQFAPLFHICLTLLASIYLNTCWNFNFSSDSENEPNESLNCLAAVESSNYTCGPKR